MADAWLSSFGGHRRGTPVARRPPQRLAVWPPLSVLCPGETRGQTDRSRTLGKVRFLPWCLWGLLAGCGGSDGKSPAANGDVTPPTSGDPCSANGGGCDAHASCVSTEPSSHSCVRSEERRVGKECR